MSTPAEFVHAVLGAGNGGLALAGDLAGREYRVRLYEHPDLADPFETIRRDRHIRLIDDAGNYATGALEVAGHDLDTVLDGAALVHLVVPVSAHEVFFEELLPRLRSDQCLILWAGRFGTLRLRMMARDRGIEPDRLLLVEVNTLPYGCRRISNTDVRIAFRAVQLYAAGLPQARTQEAMRLLAMMFPGFRVVRSPIEVALRNSSMLVLGVGPLLNVGGIEGAGGAFALFRDGMTAGVRRTIRAAHHEMIAVGRAFGVEIPTYDESIYDQPTSVEGANFRDSRGGHEGFALLTGPDRLNHRYTVENVRYGFATIAALARLHGVATPLLDGLLTIANTICGEEFARLGWWPDQLDLETLEFVAATTKCQAGNELR